MNSIAIIVTACNFLMVSPSDPHKNECKDITLLFAPEHKVSMQQCLLHAQQEIAPGWWCHKGWQITKITCQDRSDEAKKKKVEDI